MQVPLSISPKLASIQLPLRQQLYLATGKKVSTAAPVRKRSFPYVMITRKSSSQTSNSTTSSTKSSYPPRSAIAEGWDADDEDAMSADDYVPARPLSVAIPRVSGVQGPYCPRRPNLREILANTSPAPWTLAAFMAYLSNNHCLETLEFTMDAGRYRKHYAKMLSRAAAGESPPTKDKEFVQALWKRLVEAYIEPNGSREVNLPSSVRDPILNLAPSSMPPTPETLDQAVMKIYELMEESVLVPFLNSVYPQTAHPGVPLSSYDTSEENIPMSARTYEDRSSFIRRSRHGARSSPPPQSAVESMPHSYHGAPSLLNRKSAPSTLPPTLSRARFSTKLTPSTSSPAATSSTDRQIESQGGYSDVTSGSGAGMTDDSGSTGSPTNDSPMTPPTSPPMSDASPKRDSGMWKKLGRLSGMKVGKKKSLGGLKLEE